MNPDYAERRTRMVDGQLRTVDVTSLPVLDAFAAVPRERFVPASRAAFAYIDEDIEITPPGSATRRYLMEPGPFARLVQLAAIRRDDVVLDVGAGTGYSAAIFSRLAGSVIALESDPALASAANATLVDLACDNVAVVEGPLAEGYAAEAPFDVIVIEGAVDKVPQMLFDQLRDGGRLVAVEGHGNVGVARLHLKQDGVVSGRRGFNAAVEPLPGFQKEPAFQF